MKDEKRELERGKKKNWNECRRVIRFTGFEEDISTSEWLPSMYTREELDGDITTNTRNSSLISLFFCRLRTMAKRRQTMTGKEGAKERERKLEHLTRKKLKWPCFGVALVGWLGPREISWSPSGENTRAVYVYIYIYTCENNLWPVSKAYKEITKERKIFVNTENVFVFERSTSRRRLEERGVKFPGGWNFEGRKELRMESRQIPFWWMKLNEDSRKRRSIITVLRRVTF